LAGPLTKQPSPSLHKVSPTGSGWYADLGIAQWKGTWPFSLLHIKEEEEE